jgi:hypothetical protein
MVGIDGGEAMLVCTTVAIEIDVSTYSAIQNALTRVTPRALEESPGTQ